VESFVAEYGGAGLMVIAFVAATIVPIGSEAALLGAIALGLPKIEALVWASVGNCLGVTLNYWMGRLGRKSFGGGSDPTSRSGRVIRWLDRYGKWGLLLSWLPFVGDPLTLVAGITRVNFLFFVVVAYAVRILRYWLLILAMPG
jgi:membrane protein YqaA with SNARE-associated domain